MDCFVPRNDDSGRNKQTTTAAKVSPEGGDLEGAGDLGAILNLEYQIMESRYHPNGARPTKP